MTTVSPKINLPELPEEIWEEIFRWAGDLNSPIQRTPKVLSFPLPLIKRAHCKRIFTRRSLLLVCKTWYRIALPCLFEAVVILDQRGFRCQGLLNVLETYSLGHLVKRMDVYLHGASPLRPLRFLLQHCTNLRVLTVTRITLGSHGGYMDQLLRCILALPSLQFLNFPWHHCQKDFVVTLANSTIRTTSCFPGAVIAHLPALSQVHIPAEGALSPSNPFTQISLQNATSLILDYTSPYDPRDPGNPYLSNMISICRSLPRMGYVTIHLISVQKHNRYLRRSFSPTTPNHLDSRPLPPSVHTLSFWFSNARANTRAWRGFCRTLSMIHGEGIKVIRFGTEMAQDLRSRPIAYEAVNQALRARGWYLEAGDLDV